MVTRHERTDISASLACSLYIRYHNAVALKAGRPVKLDEVGVWSELKLEIFRKYATAYSTILTAKNLHHVYIDGFAGAGQLIRKATKELIPGSPLNALQVQPPFREVHLVDLDQQRVAELRRHTDGMKHAHVHSGDANHILLNEILPTIRYEDYRRALCTLDPYGLHLDWTVIAAAGAMKTVEIFLNFPILDMHRNVLFWRPEEASPLHLARMNAFWGDGSWRDAIYSGTGNLFNEPEKQSNEVIVEAFRQRLQKVAGFKRVPQPVPMRNSKGAVLYYLFFAAQLDTAEHIVLDIFERYRQRGAL